MIKSSLTIIIILGLVTILNSCNSLTSSNENENKSMSDKDKKQVGIEEIGNGVWKVCDLNFALTNSYYSNLAGNSEINSTTGIHLENIQFFS